MLEKLFTSKNRIKIIQFLFFEKEESYIREIARELKLSSNAVKREVDNLVVIGLIEKEKNKIKMNKKSNILGELKSIFIKTDYLIYPLKEALNKKEIKFAFIFGSFAGDSYKEESDVDLMVIGNIKLNDVIKIIKIPEEKTKRDINPVVWTIENLKREKNSGFIRDVFKKKIIMIRGDENELRKITR